ncbi:MAG: agmatinase [bacterium]|nr:agmatinase [bacterium]
MDKKKKTTTLSQHLYRPEPNFLGLPKEYTRFESASVVILPIPYEATTSYRSGTKFGPQAILDASRYVETYDDELDCEVYHVGIHTLPELDSNLDTVEKNINRIEQAARELIQQNKFLVSLGGEHSITLGLVRAFKRKYPKLTVVQLDAHADLRPQFEGTKFSHACVMRQIRNLGIPTVGLGIRSYSQEEAVYIKKQRNRCIYSARDLKQNPELFSEIIAALSSPIYVTIDVDVFDPAYVPGTGTPEPDGLDWETITGFLRQLTNSVDIIGFDVVELSPIGGQVTSEFLVAKLIYKFISYIFAK